MHCKSYISSQNSLFYKTLHQRVNQYFKKNHLKKTGNAALYVKAILMLSILFAPYFILISYSLSNTQQLLMCITMGLGMAGVGMNVMHDSNHQSFSSKWWMNELLGCTIYWLAGNVYNWKIQHNLLHHTFTNIENMDEDIDIQGIIRLSKHTPWKKIHQFQPIYAYFLYSLLTIHWAILVDFKQMPRYLKKQYNYYGNLNPLREWFLLITTKVMYVLFWFAIPIGLMQLSFGSWLIGFLTMHLVAGFILSIVFQMAHVAHNIPTLSKEECEKTPKDWAQHQLATTCNFATQNRILTYILGGLNHQIEHHIFPSISHVHYPAISKIVRKTCKEFNISYQEHKTLKKAWNAHFQQLKELAKPPALA